MRPFTFVQAPDAAAAVHGAARNPRAAYLAGGTTLVDLMKLGVVQPTTLVSIEPLAERHAEIQSSPRGLRLGALAKMADVAADEAVERDYPVIAQSLSLAASPQLRNMASLGGNVLQRTRCTYFRDVSWAACNKRAPGTGCAALEGVNRKHAVLGVSKSCIATYPGDLAVALVALDAAVQTLGPGGARTLPFAELHRPPAATPHIETTLEPGELILAFTVPAGDWTRRSLYLKVRDRQSYEFAAASAAVALALDGDVVREARIGLGGVATIPWRARNAEAFLAGKRLDERTAGEAARVAFADAMTRGGNAGKPELGRRTLARALIEAQRIEFT